eukprot:Nk52_evm23s1967 gene=Nk52_evmTU23s1967
MVRGGFFGKIRSLDAYPKTQDEVRIKTSSGAILSIISTVLIVLLFLNELFLYMSPEVQTELQVDTSRGEKMNIKVDIVFPKIPCRVLSIDVMDASGEQQLDVMANLYKRRMDDNGAFIEEVQKHEVNPESQPSEEDLKRHEQEAKPGCGSCYGAESEEFPCCNSCDDVQNAYARKNWEFVNPENIKQCNDEGFSTESLLNLNEGCNVFGEVQVNKVTGNFHIAPGKSFSVNSAHVHSMSMFKGKKFDTSHSIRKLSFGTGFPGKVNPLDGREEKSSAPGEMFQYFVKVVPTQFIFLSGEAKDSNQYSATLHHRVVSNMVGSQGLPGVFFMYDFSPMMVIIREQTKSFLHFVTNLCAIVGGIYTVASLIDSFIFYSMKSFKYKMEVGKAI